MSTGSQIKAISELFVKRAEAMQMTGKKRDQAALEFMLGALAVAEVKGDTALFNHLSKFVAFLVTTRGYAAVLEFSTKEIEE